MIQLQDRWTEVRVGKSVVLRAVKPCSRYQKPHADNTMPHSQVTPRFYLAAVEKLYHNVEVEAVVIKGTVQ